MRATSLIEEAQLDTDTHEPIKQHHINGFEQIRKRECISFATMKWICVFFSNGSGDFEHSRGTINDMLGLPKEVIGKVTKRAVDC